MGNQSLIKGDEVRYGKLIYLDALSNEIIDSLSTARLSETMLIQLNDGKTPVYPMSAQRVAQFAKLEGGLIFAVRLITNKTCIGVCRLTDIAWQARHAKLQISLFDEAHFSADMLIDVIQTVLQFAYWEANLNRVYVHSPEDHTVLHEALEQIGFTNEGCLRQEVYRNGCYLDILIHSILQREWSR